MRLIKYLSYSNSDNNTNKFRIMRIGLTKSKCDISSSILEEMYEKYNIDRIEPLIENLNKELKKFYNGKYFYDILFDDNIKKINEITNNKRKIEPLLLASFDANDKLSKMKSKVEECIKSRLHSV